MDGAITSWAYSGASSTSMLQQAKEELEILEAQYPNRFDYLKVELKSLISLFEAQNTTNYNSDDRPTSSSISTQASTTEKTRGHGRKDYQKVRRENKYEQVECEGHHQVTKRRRIDAVMDKAQACLNKLQLFRTSF